MEPYKENVNITDRMLPVRIFASVSYDKNINVHPHWHEEVEVLYFKKGKGTQQINSRIFRVNEGEIVIISGNDIHSTYAGMDGEVEIIVLQFNAEVFMSTNFVSSERALIESICKEVEYPNPISPEIDYWKDFKNCIDKLSMENVCKKIGYDVFVKSEIFQIIGLMLRHFAGMDKKSEKINDMAKAKAMISNTFKIIDDKYKEELTLKIAAKSCNLSVSHFSRLFKIATGMTFTEYLALYRIGKAEKLLASHISITELAFLCGFSNITSFIRTFKRIKGCSPSAYRSKLKKTLDN